MRKKWFFALALALLLTGCGAQETLETVLDEAVQPVMAQPKMTYVELPGEAASPAVETGNDRLYLCDGYEIAVQTLPGGDLQSTVNQVSGFNLDDLTLMETAQEGTKRYDFVWAAAGETGDRVAHCAILDDGNYHYCMTLIGDAERSEDLQLVWQQLFESFTLR